MVLAREFSMYPTDKGASVSDYVKRNAGDHRRQRPALPLGPMGTCLEGEWDEVMAVVTRCFEAMAVDCGRIACQIKIDARRGPAAGWRARWPR
jgi:uncharacterized protein YqgV (UPF0045/DUF77 family)